MSWRIVGCLGETSFVKIDMTHQSHKSLQMTKGFDLCMSGLKGSRYQNGLNDYNTRNSCAVIIPYTQADFKKERHKANPT